MRASSHNSLMWPSSPFPSPGRGFFLRQLLSVAGRFHQLILFADRLGVDRQTLAQLAEILFPLRPLFVFERRKRVAGAAQNLVPDVLRLPQVQLKGQLGAACAPASARGPASRAIPPRAAARPSRASCAGLRYSSESPSPAAPGPPWPIAENDRIVRHVDRVRFQGAAQSGIDGKSRGQGQRRRLGQPGLRQDSAAGWRDLRKSFVSEFSISHSVEFRMICTMRRCSSLKSEVSE